MERKTNMDNRYLEAVVVGILTAVVAGFFGLGARHSAASVAPSAASAPLVADLWKDNR
jgi:hypothetical protein